MPPNPKSSKESTMDEGMVACSPNQWASMVLLSLNIPDKSPEKNKHLWSFGIKEHAFSSGSGLSKEDYLRLRVLWYTWPKISSFRNYMRDNPTLVNDDQQSTPYTGYISPENDEIADAIYNAISPNWKGYLEDIRGVGKGGDATRPSDDCGIFWMTRYWQGLLAANLKEHYSEGDVKQNFAGKVRKSEIGLQQVAGPSRPPQTPTKQKQPRQPQEGFGTPPVRSAGASAGGLQNPATTDETYVNTALLLILQTVTRLMTSLEEKHRARSKAKSNANSKTNSQEVSRAASRDSASQPGSQPGSRPTSRAATWDRSSNSASQAGSRTASMDRVTKQLEHQPGSQPGTRTPSSQSTRGRDDRGESPTDPLAIALSKVRGLRHLDWLADRLPLNLTDRSPNATTARRMMEARVDGYLCRRDFVLDAMGNFHPRFNKFPLAIIEAKPFTRQSAVSAIRWQESAEIASWVSGLDDAYENAGLLQTSTSGRKRRLLLSQDRHELWIIIAEYGDKWKHYIRGNKLTRDTDMSNSQDVKKLAGSEGFVSLAQDADPWRFRRMMNVAEEVKNAPGSTRTSRGPKTELPGPECFCIMQQWGPYKTADAAHMDNFMRRLIGLQVELLRSWPHQRFQHPERQ